MKIYVYFPRGGAAEHAYMSFSTALAAVLIDEGFSTLEAMIDDLAEWDVHVDYTPGKSLSVDDGGARIIELELIDG